MRNNIFKYIFVVFLIIVAIVVYSFYNREKKQEEKEKAEKQVQEATINVVKELRLAIAEYDTINPILTNNRNVQEISKIIYDSLITINENYKAEPSLATEISKTSATSYVVKLRENVKWHDGSSFTANDVKFTVDTIKSESVNTVYKENLKYVNDVSIIDDNTITFNLNREVPFFEYNLTFPILSQKYYEGQDFNTTEKNRNTIGTGMFKISSSDQNVIILQRNDDYWNEERKPVLEKININFYANMGEVYNNFKNGNIDFLDADMSNVSQYIGSIGYDQEQYKGKEYDFIALNSENNVLSNYIVRKAINYSIDKNNLIVSCYGNQYSQSEFPIDYISWIYSGGADSGTNVEEARNLLSNDGWTFRNNSWQKQIDGRTTRLSFNLTVNSDNDLSVAIGENIKNQLAEVGIIVNLSRVSTQNYYDLVNSKAGYDAILVNMNTGFSPNINTFMGDGNISNYSSEDLSQILSEIKNISDEKTLKEKYKNIVEIYNRDMPFISLARRNKIVIYNTNLVGVSKPTAFNLYNHIERWYRKNY